MSPFKRTQRAAAKERAGRGRHARLSVQTESSQVPEELRPTDYEFPRVQLPESRPGVGRQVLAQLGQMDWAPSFVSGGDTQVLGRMLATPDDESTQRLPRVGAVVDESPQPAAHEGLAPAPVPRIPVPSVPFLNAGADEVDLENLRLPGPDAVLAARMREATDKLYREDPDPQAETRALVRVGNALPARLTAPELMLLGRPIPAEAPQAVRPPLHAPVRRDSRHPLVFGAFDGEFWEQIDDVVRQQHAGAGGMRMSNDAAMDALMAHLARVNAAHKAGIERIAAHEYAGRLADATRPLPHRTPGAALAAIDATRGEPVSA